MTYAIGDYVRCGRECHRVTKVDGDRLWTTRVQPPRKLRVPIFGTAPVPFGRRADVLAMLDGDIDRARLAWSGDRLYQFACPLALTIALEAQREKEAAARRWHPAQGAGR